MSDDRNRNKEFDCALCIIDVLDLLAHPQSSINYTVMYSHTLGYHQ